MFPHTVLPTNLHHRELICEQLATYLDGTDWATADMQAAESIMRSAREEWRKFHPCDRRALKPVQDRFEQLQEALHGKVKHAWDANVAAKQSIIDEAKALLDSDLASQIEGAKSLQQRWRDVGSTPRGADQRLWREFRQICDHIFAQRDADKQAKQAQYQAHQTNLEQAICALEAAGETPGPTKKALSELNEHIDNAAAELKLGQQQRQRIDAARAKYQAALKHIARETERQQLLEWRGWDEQVSTAEQAGETMAPPHPVFADRLQGDATPAEWLELVLEAEIAADIPSPAEDQATRMALQVTMMNAGRRDLAAEDYRALLRRWCSAGPKDAQANALRDRFFDALAQRI